MAMSAEHRYSCAMDTSQFEWNDLKGTINNIKSIKPYISPGSLSFVCRRTAGPIVYWHFRVTKYYDADGFYLLIQTYYLLEYKRVEVSNKENKKLALVFYSTIFFGRGP